MENNIETQKTKRQQSVQMLCVLTILTADKAIEKAVEKYIDLYNESIDWDSIFAVKWNSEQIGSIHWAYSLWTDELKLKSNPFDSALSANSHQQVAILRALALRWGIDLTQKQKNQSAT